MYYKLIDQQPVPCLLEETALMPQRDRQISNDYLGTVRVSTVFLAFEHGQSEGRPILFETMVFDPDDLTNLDNYMRRYTSFEAARLGHREIVALVRQANALEDEAAGTVFL